MHTSLATAFALCAESFFVIQERQVRSDCESERIKRSQIKKQMHTAKEKQKALVRMGVPRPTPRKDVAKPEIGALPTQADEPLAGKGATA